MKIAIVAGEKSGDILGAQLIIQLKKHWPGAIFKGLCGPLMQNEGAYSYDEMEKISVMGFDGLFSALPDILRIQRKLYREFIDWQPDLFIGIDVPDFNLRLASKLKKKGITTMHYVSPTVWAWREKRVKKIRKAIDCMLVLYPFEQVFYEQYDIPVYFVGHPLARICSESKMDAQFLQSINFDKGRWRIAVLPGSRFSEVKRLAPIFLQAACYLSQKYPNLYCVLPCANKSIREYIENIPDYNPRYIQLIEGKSQEVLAHCDIGLVACGTAALETGLFAKPMVVAYQVSKLSVLLLGWKLKVKHFSMPNHLLPQPIVPELVQQAVSVDNITARVSQYIDDPEDYQAMQKALQSLVPQLLNEKGITPAQAVVKFYEKKIQRDV